MKILVIHSWGMGDMIMATPMLKSLHASGHKIDAALFSEANKTILKGNDFLNRIYLFGSKLELLKLAFRYDALVATAGTDPKKIRRLGKLLGIKRIYASAQQKDVHRIDMNLRVAAPILSEVVREPYIYEPVATPEIMQRFVSDRKRIGFAVGSGRKQAFKRWRGFQKLMDSIEGQKFLFIGPDERELAEEYRNKDVIVVEESLENTIAMIRKLDLLVGNDNGLMHIGYASKINTVTIYGMTNEKEIGGYYANNKAVHMDMACRPCFDSSTDALGCGTLECLKNLSTEKVWRACREFL